METASMKPGFMDARLGHHGSLQAESPADQSSMMSAMGGDFGNKGIAKTSKRGLEGSWRGDEIAGAGGSNDIDSATGIHGDAGTRVIATSPKIGRIDQNRALSI